jgi:hypothetical protein
MLKPGILVQFLLALIPVVLDKCIDVSMNKKVDTVAQQVLEKQLPPSEMKDSTNRQEKQSNEDTSKKSRTTIQTELSWKEENSSIQKLFYIDRSFKTEIYISSIKTEIS